MLAINTNQSFAWAIGFPDSKIYHPGILHSGVNELEMAGFNDNDRKLASDNFILNK